MPSSGTVTPHPTLFLESLGKGRAEVKRIFAIAYSREVSDFCCPVPARCENAPAGATFRGRWVSPQRPWSLFSLTVHHLPLFITSHGRGSSTLYGLHRVWYSSSLITAFSASSR